MGRWAQRRHTGGGPSALTGTGLILVSVLLLGLDDLILTFNEPVDSGDFGASDFLTLTEGFEPVGISQNGSNGLFLNFNDELTDENALQWTPSIPGPATPQQVPIDQ